MGAEPATLLVVGGRVWTGDPARPWAEAVAARGEQVVAVGPRAEVEKLADEATDVVDAAGGLVTPGWIDSHVHLFQGGANLRSVQLRDADSRAVFVERLREHAATREPGEWILGGDWDHTLWGGELPDRAWIDEATPRNPVWINRLDGHMALANTLALERAGVEEDVAAPAGGAIERDDSGRLTGLLRDNAMALVERVVPDESASERLAALDAAVEYLLANGVTTVCHMGTLDQARLLRSARQSGRLRVRVHASTPLSGWELLLAEIERAGPGDGWVRLGGLKGFVDGSLGSHTAAMLEPFTDQPTDRGLLVNSEDDLYAWIKGADAAGLVIRVHAIGDRANRLLLDIYERVATENGPRDRRFRIEHAQHLHPDDLPRFAGLGVIPSVQPYHAIDDGRWAEGVIGAERCRTTYAFRSLLDSGARLAFGSDWFVAPASVLEGVRAAVYRRTLDGVNPDGWVPEEKITPEEALHAYTTGAAHALFEESRLGVLRPGAAADLVVSNVDWLADDAQRLPEAAVRTTIVGGRVAYDAAAAE